MRRRSAKKDSTRASSRGLTLCTSTLSYPAALATADCGTTPVRTLPGDAAWLEVEFARLAPKKSWQHGNLLVENGKEHDKMTVEAIDQLLEAFVNYVIVKQLFCMALVLRVV